MNERFKILDDGAGRLEIIDNSNREKTRNIKTACAWLNKQDEIINRVFQFLDNKLEENPPTMLPIKMETDCRYRHSCLGNQEKNVYFNGRRRILLELKWMLEEYDW